MLDELTKDEVAARLTEVRRQIDEATAKAGRPPASVRLLAVSKGKPAEAIRWAYAMGQRDFGENYAQELAQKAEELKDLADITWHFTGRLQRNKAKQVVPIAGVVHTVDRPDLAREMGKRAEASGLKVKVLAEVNVGGEANKGGCAPDELKGLLTAISAERSLLPIGLMTIPPDTEDAAEALPFFAKLRALRDGHGGASTLPELSMGMTHDFRIAIWEGATIVRIGTAIFGARAKPGA